MKTPTLAFLNSLGFQNDAQKTYFAAKLLSIALYPQKASSISYGTRPLLKMPAINPILPYAGTCTIEWTGANQLVKFKLPYNHAKVSLMDGGIDSLLDIYEITPSALQISWYKDEVSYTPETVTWEPPTLEGYLFKYGLNTFANISTNGTPAAKAESFLRGSFVIDAKGIKIPVYDFQLLLANKTTPSNNSIGAVDIYR